MDQRAELIEQIVQLNQQLFRSMQSDQSSDWLSVDLTMPQLKVLMSVYLGPSTAGQLARALGVGLSTVTGIVDRLCDHSLVVRSEDQDDRRVTRVSATDAGRALMDRLYRDTSARMARLLGRLDLEALQTIEQGARYMLDAAGTEAGRPHTDSDRVAAVAR